MPRRLLEICIDSVEGAIAAEQGGADRLELCSALSEGGLSPSYGLIQQVVATTSLPTMVMIRPRGGEFVYSPSEIDVMLRDIDAVKEIGVAGVVFGMLTENGEVDRELNARLLKRAKPLEVTFHRAFDEVADPKKALVELIQIGFRRLLTSGQQPTAAAGVELICELAQESGALKIMPGAGVRPENAEAIIRQTGAREIHGTASKTSPANASRRVTCRETVRAIRVAIDRVT